MLFSRRPVSVASVLLALGLVMVGCSDSKVAQCNRLIDVANTAVEDVQSVTDSARPDDTNAYVQIANTADRASKELESIELSDEQLQTFKDRLITLYAETSQATRNLVAAVNQQDNQAAQEAYNSLQSTISQEPPLVNEVNEYCGGTPAQDP